MAIRQQPIRIPQRMQGQWRLRLARAADGFDAAAWNSGHLAYLAVLHLDDGFARQFSIQSAELGGWHPPVRGLPAVLVKHVEQDEAVCDGLFLGHWFLLAQRFSGASSGSDCSTRAALRLAVSSSRRFSFSCFFCALARFR